MSFLVNEEKVVCHFYNTTQLILCNGSGYGKLVELFLKPFFQARVNNCSQNIAEYNELALSTLGSKGVRRSSIKIPTRSISLWSNKCDYVKKSHTALMKHKKSDHLVLRTSPCSTLVLPEHQSTRNNSVSEPILPENITLTESLEDNEGRSGLAFNCLMCEWKTNSKKMMGKHLTSNHDNSPVTYVCKVCSHSFDDADDHNEHLKLHDSSKVHVITQTKVLLSESIDKITDSNRHIFEDANTNSTDALTNVNDNSNRHFEEVNTNPTDVFAKPP